MHWQRALDRFLRISLIMALVIAGYGMTPLCADDKSADGSRKVGSRNHDGTEDRKKNDDETEERKKGKSPAPPQKPLQIIVEPGDGVTRTKYHNVKERFTPVEKIKPLTPKSSIVEQPQAAAVVSAAATAAATAPSLILYDANPALPFNRLGRAYAIMLYNLLGHFGAQGQLMPVESYTPGTITPYQTIFYLGSLYDNAIPQAFLADVAQTTKTVVWFKYNLWRLAWNPTFNFPAQRGFTFSQLLSLDGQPSAANPNPGFFDTVLYKGASLTKFYQYDAATGIIYGDPEIGATQITDPAKAQTAVAIRNSRSQAQAPYIVRSGNFWYFADIPFSYIGPRDRYLVLCDILHDILNSNIQQQHRALVRLEDVAATVDPSAMRTLTDYLFAGRIPFSIAVIPFYRDPLGVYNGGVPQEIHFANATDLRSALQYAMTRGGRIVMHGYTHQYGATRNPWSGVSADDFEFWDIVRNRPVGEDSLAWATGRLNSGLSELAAGAIVPFAWEIPHYQGSPNAYRAAAQRFSTTYQRVVYYTSDTQLNLTPGDPNRDFAVGQFFPYIIASDYYGQRILPENLGNIEYDISHIDPSSNVVYTWQDIVTNAQYARLVRDGFASFFFHPFWLEPDLGVPGFQDFQRTIQGITNLGFQWVDAGQL